MTTRKGDHGGAWDDAKVERLKHLISIGAGSASQIGGMLGVNRSQVIGKCSRMGLKLPGSDGRKPRAARAVPPKTQCAANTGQRSAKPAFVAVVEALPLPRADDIARKSMADLGPDECKFPIGDPGTAGFGFCASERVPGLPYCAGHAARCFVPPNNMKSRRKYTSQDQSQNGSERVLPASELV